MPNDQDTALHALREAARKLAAERYGDAADPRRIDERAAQAGDVEYLLARVRHLEADLNRVQGDVRWIGPHGPVDPKEALRRIRAICTSFPDLFGAVFAVLATHQGVPRQALAAAIKTFRSDTAALSEADVAALFVGLWNSGREGFESILRTRKGGKSKASLPTWLKTDD
jgi:hypothetical protein